MTVIEKYKTVGFNEELEANFLASLDNFEMRREVLEKEVTTAINEVFLQKFENGYDFEDGKIVDKVTKRPIEGLVINCGREPEIVAMDKIQNELSNQRDLVVHFSPKNEEYDYPMDCVDFWWKNGKEVRWMRVVVNDNFESIKQVYKSIGGEKKETVMEMLASPVGVDDIKIADVLKMLNTAEEINKITDERIRNSVRILMDGFVEKFDKEIVENPEIIFRLFSAAIAEAKMINEDEEDYQYIDDDQMWEYLNAEMEIGTMSTSGCASVNNVGEFNRGVEMYLVSDGRGGLTIVQGEAPEGYKLCKHCGLYYKGDKCPICD